jgi:transcriptional regulator with XRE-family HTH domain
VDDVRIGRLLRALRRRRGLRQLDIAGSAGISQQSVSLIERGHLATLSTRVLRLAFAAVDARYEGLVSWRGGQVDRLLDERHALLLGQVASDLASFGWQVATEVTFAVFAERGSVDLFALRPDRRIALVIEIKTEITAVDDTVRRLDVKDRLCSRIVEDRFGWRPIITARLLVVLDSTTSRRRVAAHDRVLIRAFPHRGDDVRAWLRQPRQRISGLVFVGLRR